jgi:segregation and condensation protein A
MRRIPRETIYEVEGQEITVEMRKGHVLSMFEGQNSVTFEDLFLDDPRKIVMVVTFVAILELIRQGVLSVEQATSFSPIRLFKGEFENQFALESA